MIYQYRYLYLCKPFRLKYYLVMFQFVISVACVLPIKHLIMMTHIFVSSRINFHYLLRLPNITTILLYYNVSKNSLWFFCSNSGLVIRRALIVVVKYLSREGKPCIRVGTKRFRKSSSVQVNSACNIKVIIA